MNKYKEALEHIVNCDREDGGVSHLSDAYRNDICNLMELVRMHDEEDKSCSYKVNYEEVVHELESQNYEMAKIIGEQKRIIRSLSALYTNEGIT